MLDTRFIEGFVKPQKTIDTLNNFGEHRFSPWTSTSTNVLITELLKEHIALCMADDNNTRKLFDTMLKLGIKKKNQMMILTHTGVFVMYEPCGDRSMLMATGRLGKQIEIHMSMQVEYLEEGDTSECICQFLQIYTAKNLGTINTDMTKLEAVNHMSAIMAGWYLYLQFVETETVYVEPKQKFKAKKYEGFKNQQSVRIQVADIGWSKDIISKVPVGVSGHFRNQACGPGHLDRKLIYIDPFQRNYHRKSGKDRILKS